MERAVFHFDLFKKSSLKIFSRQLKKKTITIADVLPEQSFEKFF